MLLNWARLKNLSLFEKKQYTSSYNNLLTLNVIYFVYNLKNEFDLKVSILFFELKSKTLKKPLLIFSFFCMTSINYHCVKSVRIRSYFVPYFPAFGLNTKRNSVSLRIQSECGKIRTRITPNTDTFYLVYNSNCHKWIPKRKSMFTVWKYIKEYDFHLSILSRMKIKINICKQ